MTLNKRLFQLIDLDRTLFDTALFIRLLTEEVDVLSPGLGAELDARFEAAYKREETFFLMAYLRERYGDDAFNVMVARVVEREGADRFLLPGARERIALADQLTSVRPSWGIFTFGDAIDQYLKLQIIGLDQAPCYIADTPDKATVIKSWRQSNSMFTLPDSLRAGMVDSITFEDDKRRAFEGLPNQAYGIMVNKDFETMTTLDIPAAHPVVGVPDLYVSMEYLKSLMLEAVTNTTHS